MSSGPQIALGIIGGGQLAQMLVQNNPFHDFKISIFTENANCPAANTDATLVVGKLSDQAALRGFFEKIQILTLENEFIDAEILSEMKDAFAKVFFFPSIPAIQITQNKLSQKFLFQKLGLPTAEFLDLQPGVDDVQEWLQKVSKKFPQGFMLKKAFGGYDGKGNFKVVGDSQFADAQTFISESFDHDSAIYAEALIPFERELAQIYVRGLKNDFISYPLVISEQEENVCRLVYGPAVDFGVSAEVESLTKTIGEKIAHELGFVGTFAIEYFQTHDGKILINEMAPRVHNSGHYTLDASPQNQFENHMRAILGAPLKTPSTYNFFAMRNILGPDNIDKNLEPNVEQKFMVTEDAKVYWYNKTKALPFRKLGHINTIAMTKPDILKKIELMQKMEADFWSKV